MKYPKKIDIELNTNCNLKCEPCPYKEDHKNHKLMKFSLYKEIIDQIDWYPSIKLCQRGEPLLSPILIKSIRYAHKQGLRTVINTNGILLLGNTELLKSGLNELILSDYNMEMQKIAGKNFSYMNQMYGYPIFFTVKTNHPEVWEGICDLIIEPIYYDYSDKSEDRTPLTDWQCPQLYERLIIEPDGKVRCCCGNIHPQKYVGDLKKESLKEIWFSPTLNKYRWKHNNGLSHELEMCAQCAYRKSFISNKS